MPYYITFKLDLREEYAYIMTSLFKDIHGFMRRSVAQGTPRRCAMAALVRDAKNPGGYSFANKEAAHALRIFYETPGEFSELKLSDSIKAYVTISDEAQVPEEASYYSITRYRLTANDIERRVRERMRNNPERDPDKIRKNLQVKAREIQQKLTDGDAFLYYLNYFHSDNLQRPLKVEFLVQPAANAKFEIYGDTQTFGTGVVPLF